jgi:delta8-fatty-acid desaturase
MLGCAGRDATEVFTGFHPDWVWTQKLPYFHIANLTAEDAKVQEQSIHYECVKDFRRIREQLMQEGLFQTNYWWYFRKFLWQLFLFISAISCTLLSTNLYVNLLGALLLGFFWQQVAFIGHDLCHNAVTHNRVVDTLIACVTTTLFGVSAEWWKRSHNTHHVVTNSLEHDPDIQHLPVFAISEKFFNKVY